VNALQVDVLRALRRTDPRLTVVGDDSQAVYGFRGASPRHLLEIEAAFPGISTIVLERNYRSVQPILDVANAVSEGAPEGFMARLRAETPAGERPRLVRCADEDAQVDSVCEQILAHREEGIALRDQAVLVRAAHHSDLLELELSRRRIPYVKYGGLRFLEAAHVKDALAILRFAENPRCRTTGFRVLQLVDGVGPATARRLLDAIAASPAPATVIESYTAPAAAGADWCGFVALHRALAASDLRWPADIELALDWYEPRLHRLYDDAAARQGDLAQLRRIAATFASRERFLTEVTLDPPEAASDEAGIPSRNDDYLILSTIHSAKGQEWTSVHVLNVVDGCIPSDLATGRSAEIDEERRLLYVAMTRAKESLALMLPQRFYVREQPPAGDRYVHALPSRFLAGEPMARFDDCVWPEPPEPTKSAAASPRSVPAIDLAARVRAAWRPR